MAAWLPTPLTTARLVVRRPQPGDEDALAALLTNTEVRRFVGGPLDAGPARTRAARIVAEAAWGAFVLAERHADSVVGSGDISRKRGPWEISYQLRPAAWGAGLACEAVRCLVDWFFANTDEQELIAVTQEANERSIKTLERVGATLVTRFEQYGLLQRQYLIRP